MRFVPSFYIFLPCFELTRNMHTLFKKNGSFCGHGSKASWLRVGQSSPALWRSKSSSGFEVTQTVWLDSDLAGPLRPCLGASPKALLRQAWVQRRLQVCQILCLKQNYHYHNLKVDPCVASTCKYYNVKPRSNTSQIGNVTWEKKLTKQPHSMKVQNCKSHFMALTLSCKPSLDPGVGGFKLGHDGTCKDMCKWNGTQPRRLIKIEAAKIVAECQSPMPIAASTPTSLRRTRASASLSSTQEFFYARTFAKHDS